MESLLEIGNRTGTDKVVHEYLPHYAGRFEAMRHMPIQLLEIGVMKGDSLRMWRDYFSESQVFGIDAVQESIFSEERIQCFKGRQEDEAFLRQVIDQTGDLDVVIDDGSHRGVHHVASFNFLWPFVKPGGWYCIEDAITIFDVCWTAPGDRTMCDVIQEQWEPILRTQSDIAEVSVIGCGTQKPKIGRNNGLIFLQKARGE